MFLVIFLLVCFLAGLAASALWLRLALERQWFDIPNQRSSHTRPTPKGGGLGFAFVCLGVVLILVWQDLLPLIHLWLLLPGCALAAIGFLDDLVDLGILPRLGLQVLAVVAALWMMPDLPPISLPMIGSMPVVLTVLVLTLGWIWLINLYNFMDGIDGLAAAEAVFVALALGWFAMRAGLYGSSLLLLALGVVMGAFLCFNWSPARLFMGDAGSNFLGYVLVAYGLLLVAADAITVWTLLILLAVFIADTSTTLVKRLRAGVVWYHGHRSHAYQLVASAHRSHALVVEWVTAINVVWLLPLAWLSTRVEAEQGVLVALVAFMPLLLSVHWCQTRYLDGSMH
jgi:Fuc2NAc and GlcNAc transferase